MSSITHRFAREKDVEFFQTLKQRVNNYFKTNNISRYGNFKMVIKAVVMLAMFFVPYGFIVSGIVTSPWLFIGLWMIMGLGMSGIGMGVMHDANHGVYSKNRKWNNIIRNSSDLVGANSDMWRIQHNVLHHTYTNIENADEDIDTPVIFRFSPHQKKYWIHRFQHLYFWLFYGLSTLYWVVAKDFVQIVKYKKRGLIKDKEYGKFWRRMVSWKAFYWFYILVPTIMFSGHGFWMVLLGWFSMQFVAGLTLSLIFQLAHVMPSTDFPLPDEDGNMENNWAVHQMITTTNFAPKSKVLSWYVGGLNFQIEHHLFTNISHVHYKDLSKIVADTAKQFNIPYYTEKNFVTAIWGHISLLRDLGREKQLVPVQK